MIRTFTKESMVDGKIVDVRYVEIAGQIYSLSGRALTILRLDDEWFDDVLDPEAVVTAVKRSGVKADLFTFWQRLPDTEPRFSFHTEWETIAALPVSTFSNWRDKQIKSATRNHLRGSQKKGVQILDAVFDDAFVRGMTEIFNETPVRQGRPFWHYGKDFKTVKEQWSRYLFREDLIAAYHRDEMIGFSIVADAGRYAVLGQFISKIKHRDKGANNALIAKAVEVTERRKLPYLVYGYWSDGTFANFKKENAFEPISLPRYYIPLTLQGRLALHLGLHRGWKGLLPNDLRIRLKALRAAWLRRREPLL